MNEIKAVQYTIRAGNKFSWIKSEIVVLVGVHNK